LLSRLVDYLLVAAPPVPDLLLCAKHLLSEANRPFEDLLLCAKHLFSAARGARWGPPPRQRLASSRHRRLRIRGSGRRRSLWRRLRSHLDRAVVERL